MKRAFVTGVGGFVGGHLCADLLAQGYEVSGGDVLADWAHGSVDYYTLDILDVAELVRIIGDARPDEIYHLAGVSYPPDADASPRRSLDINIMGCVSLLDAVRQVSPDAVTLVVGSSKIYDGSSVSGAVREDTGIGPTSFYGISKLAAEMIGHQFVRQMGIDVRFTRSFNHTGPGQSPRFVCSDWARQVARIQAGLDEPALKVGDLSVEIDFTDVRDVVTAYQAIVRSGARDGVYNVCTGRTVPLRQVLDYLCGKTERRITVQSDEARTRGHATNRSLTGDNSQLVKDTGWKPKIALEKTLDDLFEFWLDREAG